MNSMLFAAAPPGGLRTAFITERGASHVDMYLEAMSAAGEIESVVLHDPSGDSEAAARKILGPKLAAVKRDLTPRDCPLAIVSMSAATSPPAIRAALDAGCHVLAEKPACVRAADFAALLGEAKKRGRLLLLALANRVDPVALAARDLVTSGQLGKVYGVEVHLIADQTRLTRAAYRSDWRASKAAAGGGHLIWLGIHWIDLATFIANSQVRAVSAFTANAGGQPLDVEDSAAVALQFDNGAVGTLLSAYWLDKGYHSSIRVWGSRGWLRMQKHEAAPLEWSTHDRPGIQRWQPPQNYSTNTYAAFVGAVARAAAGAAPPPLTGEESLAALRAVFASYDAAATGRAQQLR